MLRRERITGYEHSTSRVVRIRALSVGPVEHSLLRDGQVVPLEPKVFSLLLVLVENNGRLLQKDELLKDVWPDTFVEEGNLNRNISILRKALGADPSGNPYIETVPKLGYKFVAPVRKVTHNGSGTVSAEALDKDSPVSDADLFKAAPKGDNRPKQTPGPRRWLVLGSVVVLALGIGMFVLLQSRRAEVNRHEIKSIAVLPLVNLSGDPAQEYFADGMTEALISSLAQIRALRVISRTSVMTFKESKKKLPEIARELGVVAVVQGSVQRDHGRVKVLIQLIHGPTDTHLWARDYERPPTDVLKLQGEMARAIADEIRTQLTPEEETRMSSAASVNPAAYQEYLLGRYHFGNTSSKTISVPSITSTGLPSLTRAMLLPMQACPWRGRSGQHKAGPSERSLSRRQEQPRARRWNWMTVFLRLM